MSEPVREIGIQESVGLMRRRWRWIVLTPLIIVVLVGAFSATRQPVYEATAEVLILTDANQAIFQTDAATTDRLRRNPVAEQQYLTSEDFRNVVGPEPDGVESVTFELGRTDADQDLADVAILRFVAASDTATGASDAANAAAELYLGSRHEQDRARVAARLELLDATLVRLRADRAEIDDQLVSLREGLGGELSNAEAVQLQANIAILEEEQLDLVARVRETTSEIATLEQVSSDLDDPFAAARIQNAAVAPTAPVSPNVERNIVLAAIAGLVLGVALAIARDLLDGSARDPVELARITGTPVLGTVEESPTDGDEATPADAHSYRTILNSLALSSASPTLRTIGVTSATASVGKTETVVNLARVEASAGSRVLIFDGNPVTPMVLSLLDPSERRETDIDRALAVAVSTARHSGGAGDRTRARARTSSAQKGNTTRRVPKIDVIELFASATQSRDPVRQTAMEPVLEKLAEHYDVILIDTHALLSAIGVLPLLTGADAVVVVYDPRRSQTDDLRRSVELLREGGVHVSGLIAHRASAAARGPRFSRSTDDSAP